MNGSPPPQTFTDFMSPTASDEGPVATSNIERQRYKKRRMPRDKSRHKRRRTRRAT
jgi:hypothetical protein